MEMIILKVELEKDVCYWVLLYFIFTQGNERVSAGQYNKNHEIWLQN